MRKLLKFGVFALLGGALTCSVASCSDDDPDYSNVTPPTVAEVHNISGSIAGIDGKGISGATVTMAGTASGTATTDANGYFVFENVKAGSYTLKAEAAGKMPKETSVSVTENGKGKNAVWNVMLASEESVTTVTVGENGGSGNTTTEALEGNDKAEVPVAVSAPANSLNKSASIEVSPIYSADEAAAQARSKVTGTRAAANTLVVGAKLSCSDNSVRIETPLELTFDVDDVTISEVKAQKYSNGRWVDVPVSTTADGKIVIAVDEFTAYGLFCNINFSTSSRNETISFAQSEWNNLYGSDVMNIGTASYTYKVGMDINTAGTSVFTALLVEAMARAFGANSYTATGNYPINVALPIGTYLKISGTQQINTVTASVGRRSVSGTQYGDVTITVTTANRQHTGGSGGSNVR